MQFSLFMCSLSCMQSAELTAVAGMAEGCRRSHSISSSSGAGIAIGIMPLHAAMPGSAGCGASVMLGASKVTRGNTAAGWCATAVPDCRLECCSSDASSLMPPYSRPLLLFQ